MRIHSVQQSSLGLSPSPQPITTLDLSRLSASCGSLWHIPSFPHDTFGWCLWPSSAWDPLIIMLNNADSNASTTQIWHYQVQLLCEPQFSIFGWLMNKYVVDIFSCRLDSYLCYICANQEHLCMQEQDAAPMGHEDLQDSENIYLPVSSLFWALGF